MKRRVYVCLVLMLFAAFIFWSVGVTAEEAKRELRVTFSWPTYIDPAVGSDFSSSRKRTENQTLNEIFVFFIY